MQVIRAMEQQFDIVKDITMTTIEEVYPKYYPRGAVDFFKDHHSDSNIMTDICAGLVYLLCDEETFVGTVTVKNNEICRLFVSPRFQHRGYGQVLLNFAENEILHSSNEIVLDASLPAKKIYQLRGYLESEYHQMKLENGYYLCYDVMKKHI